MDVFEFLGELALKRRKLKEEEMEEQTIDNRRYRQVTAGRKSLRDISTLNVPRCLSWRKEVLHGWRRFSSPGTAPVF
jgi:hypothetical protein